MISVGVDLVRNGLTYGSAVPVLIAILVARFLVNTVVRALIVVVALALGVLIFTQRSRVDDCLKNVDPAQANVRIDCSLLGRHLQLDL